MKNKYRNRRNTVIKLNDSLSKDVTVRCYNELKCSIWDAQTFVAWKLAGS